MTNAQKWLKDGASVEEFAEEIESYYYNSPFESELEAVESFLKAPVQPTLTEDEKVILRNIDTSKYNKIGVYDDTLMLFSSDELHEELYFLKQGLFQFIKERRRI